MQESREEAGGNMYIFQLQMRHSSSQSTNDVGEFLAITKSIIPQNKRKRSWRYLCLNRTWNPRGNPPAEHRGGSLLLGLSGLKMHQASSQRTGWRSGPQHCQPSLVLITHDNVLDSSTRVALITIQLILLNSKSSLIYSSNYTLGLFVAFSPKLWDHTARITSRVVSWGDPVTRLPLKLQRHQRTSIRRQHRIVCAASDDKSAGLGLVVGWRSDFPAPTQYQMLLYGPRKECSCNNF